MNNVDTPDFLPARLPETPAAAPVVVPVMEEVVVVGRETVESGRVRLNKLVHEHDEHINLTLQHDEVKVDRVPVNQYVPDGAELPVSRHEGDTLIIPVLREVVVTRVLVVEEIRVTRQQLSTAHTETVVLRREEVQVERQPSSAPDSSATPFA